MLSRWESGRRALLASLSRCCFGALSRQEAPRRATQELSLVRYRDSFETRKRHSVLYATISLSSSLSSLPSPSLLSLSELLAARSCLDLRLRRRAAASFCRLLAASITPPPPPLLTPPPCGSHEVLREATAVMTNIRLMSTIATTTTTARLASECEAPPSMVGHQSLAISKAGSTLSRTIPCAQMMAKPVVCAHAAPAGQTPMLVQLVSQGQGVSRSCNAHSVIPLQPAAPPPEAGGLSAASNERKYSGRSVNALMRCPARCTARWLPTDTEDPRCCQHYYGPAPRSRTATCSGVGRRAAGRGRAVRCVYTRWYSSACQAAYYLEYRPGRTRSRYTICRGDHTRHTVGRRPCITRVHPCIRALPLGNKKDSMSKMHASRMGMHRARSSTEHPLRHGC